MKIYHSDWFNKKLNGQSLAGFLGQEKHWKEGGVTNRYIAVKEVKVTSHVAPGR